jgi:hypothetical protein
MQMSRYSKEYVFIPVSGDGVADLTHEVAITRTTTVVEDDWLEADWDTDEAAARLLVRASTAAEAGGDITLEPGFHVVHWRASSNPEYPARRAGNIRVQ